MMMKQFQISKSKQIALCALLCATGVVFMLIGSIIPLATFCCPAIVMLLLIPAARECGTGTGFALYFATAFLSALLVPDKEIAMLYIFIGYYPLVKTYIDKIKFRVIRICVKFLLFNTAIAVMYGLAIFLLQMEALVAEYQQVTVWILIALCVMGNFAFALYDILINRFCLIYNSKIRKRFFKE